MKCFHCGKQEADYRFFVNFMGRAGEVHLCSRCLEQIKNYTGGMARALEEIQRSASVAPEEMWQAGPTDAPAMPAGFPFPGRAVPPRPLGQDPFPLDAGSEVKRHRRLNALKSRIRHAVEREDYESAAALRDELLKLQQIEEGVSIYDS